MIRRGQQTYKNREAPFVAALRRLGDLFETRRDRPKLGHIGRLRRDLRYVRVREGNGECCKLALSLVTRLDHVRISRVADRFTEDAVYCAVLLNNFD
jgi:hypothetical protein